MRKLDVLKSTYDSRDYLAASIYPTSYELPRKVDYTSKLQKIRNQGTQGACAGFAGACMKEVHEYNDVDLQVYLSPQFIYNHREDPDVEGMYMRDLMKILSTIGVCTEDTYPYGKRQDPSNISVDAINEASNFKIESYARVDTIDACKRALYQNGPCVIAVPVYHYDDNIWKPKSYKDEILGGHAMSIIGYDDDKEFFIIRNSWGRSWGNNGYTYFPYSDWGMQWEIWTSVDAESEKIPEIEDKDPEPDAKGCNFIARIFGK